MELQWRTTEDEPRLLLLTWENVVDVGHELGLDPRTARREATGNCLERNRHFRPHLKTAKSLDVACLAMTASAGPAMRILPNHACATGAQHDRYHVLNGAGLVNAVWP